MHRRGFMASTAMGAAGLSPLSPVEVTAASERSLYHVHAEWSTGDDLVQPVFATSSVDAVERFTSWWRETGAIEQVADDAELTTIDVREADQ